MTFSEAVAELRVKFPKADLSPSAARIAVEEAESVVELACR
jgi:hypothetical protein